MELQNQLWDSSSIYSWSYDTLGNQTYELYRQMNQVGVLDTSHAYYWSYDSLGRIVSWDYYSNNFASRSHQNFVYDAVSNIIAEYAYDTWSRDSTRQLKSYTPSNKKQETVFQEWDTLSSVWNYEERVLYGYDLVDSLLVEYTFRCPDTTCSDTALIRRYQYDIFYNILAVIDSVIDSTGVQVHYRSHRVYDANGNLISASYPGDGSHCSGSEHYDFEYNSSNQVIHENHTRYTCDMWEDDCYYYSLTGDSMLVDLYYTFTSSNAICQGDTIYPGFTVLGGTPPYTYQWSPSSIILNQTLSTTGIIADTIPYLLQATDSLGNIQSDSLKLNLYCFVTGVSEMTSQSSDIYPNPFHDKLFVNPKFSNSIIYDLQGREILMSRIANGIINIDRQRITPGFYFLKMFNDSGFEKVEKILAD